jgi:hypothetical protein
MKIQNLNILVLNLLILCYVIFHKFHSDMTFRFSMLIIFNVIQGSFFADKKLRQINYAISIVIVIVIFILGYKFDYFKS